MCCHLRKQAFCSRLPLSCILHDHFEQVRRAKVKFKKAVTAKENYKEQVLSTFCKQTVVILTCCCPTGPGSVNSKGVSLQASSSHAKLQLPGRICRSGCVALSASRIFLKSCLSQADQAQSCSVYVQLVCSITECRYFRVCVLQVKIQQAGQMLMKQHHAKRPVCCAQQLPSNVKVNHIIRQRNQINHQIIRLRFDEIWQLLRTAHCILAVILYGTCSFQQLLHQACKQRCPAGGSSGLHV